MLEVPVGFVVEDVWEVLSVEVLVSDVFAGVLSDDFVDVEVLSFLVSSLFYLVVDDFVSVGLLAAAALVCSSLVVELLLVVDDVFDVVSFLVSAVIEFAYY